LDISNNKIQEVPVALPFFLSNLTALSLGNNDLVKLPNLIGMLPNLKNVQVEGNPLKTIRMQIIQKGSEAII
jgi:Leucine-rich repeat (LRR) protein